MIEVIYFPCSGDFVDGARAFEVSELPQLELETEVYGIIVAMGRYEDEGMGEDGTRKQRCEDP